jgi:hypothetical protein
MHLAVKTSEEIRTTRSIRGLLLKGANPVLLDKDGRKPKDLLEDFD